MSSTFPGVNRDLPVSCGQELIALVKAEPGALDYASGDAGSPRHLATEVFQAFTGVTMTHAPFKGANQATTARSTCGTCRPSGSPP